MKTGINGFNGLRSRPSIPVAGVKAKRHCSTCGATLVPSNLSELCRPCDGVRLPEDIPDWVMALVESGGEGGLRAAARILGASTPDDRRLATRARNAEIKRLCGEGMSLSKAGALFGIKRRTVQDVLDDGEEDRRSHRARYAKKRAAGEAARNESGNATVAER